MWSHLGCFLLCDLIWGREVFLLTFLYSWGKLRVIDYLLVAQIHLLVSGIVRIIYSESHTLPHLSPNHFRGWFYNGSINWRGKKYYHWENRNMTDVLHYLGHLGKYVPWSDGIHLNSTTWRRWEARKLGRKKSNYNKNFPFLFLLLYPF